jgi:pimeloyl-ACP methyl ester carboxylesterase
MALTREIGYLPGYPGSYALLAPGTDVDTVAIFVHGFGGKPTSTWTDFQRLVDEYSEKYPWWKTVDMFFYAYDSIHTPIRANAKFIENFVEDVWSGLSSESSPEGGHKYKSLVLVGHSEGGVIIRRLVLDRYESIKQTIGQAFPEEDAETRTAKLNAALEADFILSSHLRLFAPACLGTNFSSWVGFLTSFSTFVAALTATSLVRNELLPTSPVLLALKDGTEKAHAESPNVSALYTRPIFGIPDQVVISDSYRGEKPWWDKGHDHFTICKPNYLHLRPLEFASK